MQGKPETARRSAQARDAAALRLRRVTQLSVAVMVAVGGTFTALAAGSTQARKTASFAFPPASRAGGRARPGSGAAARRRAKRATASVAQAPADPAVPAPAPTYQQPVVVSGGS